MITFFLGFITGVILILSLVIIETYLDIKKKKIIETIKEIVVDKVKQKGVIIPPETDKEVARNDLIKYNRDRGEGTNLKDLDL